MNKTDYLKDDEKSADTDTTVSVINGVKYIVCSFFDGDKPICDKIEDLIVCSFEASATAEITNEPFSSLR